MSTVIESGIGSLNYVKQTAKGTIGEAASTAVGSNRPKFFDGGLMPKPTLGEEEYIDGARFGSPTQYVDKVGGEVGGVTIQSQPENGGLFYAQILGVDTVTGASDPFTHTITSAGTSGTWGTWWQKVGAAVGPERQLYSDSKIAKDTMVCGDKQKTMHRTLDIQSLNAGEIYAVDPAKKEDTSDPFYWTDTTGAVTFDGTVLGGVNEETLEIDTGLKPYWGNDVAPIQLIEGKGTIISAVSAIVTDETLAKIRKAIYGETAPAAGKKPVKEVYYASLSTVYTKSATRKLTIERPRIAVKPDEMAVPPQREGGEIPVKFGGTCLKNGVTPALTVIALTGDATAYA